jgi:hypothetical protein
MFEISCIEIPRYYMDEELAGSEAENFEKFITNKENIYKKIIMKLTTSSTENSSNAENLSIRPDAFMDNFGRKRLVNIII